jgi:FeS assembly SUF system protein
MTEQHSINAEEVASVTPPPHARVEDAQVGEAGRAPDYLDGFLKAAPPPEGAGEPGGALYEAVVAGLREIYDPEIPVNIYDLGLIYDLAITGDAHVTVTMTLTTPHCPVAESMPGEVEMQVGAVPGVGAVDVDLVWDPPWDPSKMSDEAKLELGML